MRRLAVFGAALLLTALVGCSAIVREVEPNCDDGCAALNKQEGLGESDCIVYQCREDEKGCDQKPRDLDRDQYPDRATCGDAGLPGPLDCDDTSDASAPDAGEICDGVDNDCDFAIDEGALGQDSLQKPDSLELSLASPISTLRYTEPAPGQLLVAVTTKLGTSNRTSLHSWPDPRRLALQRDQQSFCEGRSRSCTFTDLAPGASADTLVALGIEGPGPDVGRVRFALLKEWSVASEPTLFWDGASVANSASNVKAGVDADAGCGSQGVSKRTSAPSFVFDGLAPSRGEGLALWRAGADGTPAPLVGVAVGVRASMGGLQLDTRDDWCSRRLSDPSAAGLGLDAAAIRTWPQAEHASYFVAYDSAYGVELAWLSQPSMGAVRAFADARTWSHSEPGARQVALAVTSDPIAATLGLAWRAPDAGHWAIRFMWLTFTSEGGYEAGPEVLDIAGGIEVVEGPAIAYAARGFEVAADGTESGGWFVIWVQESAGARQLAAARVSGRSGSLVGEPFVLFEGAERVFAFGGTDAPLGYGFVAGEPEAQLNIGSLVCRP